MRQEGVYDFGKKTRLLLGLLSDRIKSLNVELNSGAPKDPAKQELLGRMKTFKSTLDSFDKEVIWTRNVLAHVQESTDAHGHVILKSTITKGGGEFTINHDWCVKIRKDLARHRNALKELLQLPHANGS